MRSVKTWLSTDQVAGAICSAKQYYPLETGGLLFGYRVAPREFVINTISLAGPSATRTATSYTPDYSYDEDFALRQFALCGYDSIYLGDWHSHPGAQRAYLSRKDRAALKNIANSDVARLPSPLCMILNGKDSDWDYRLWVGEIARALFGLQFLVTVRSEIKEY